MINSKFFIGFICFVFGLAFSQLFNGHFLKINKITKSDQDIRIPVTEDDFDQDKLLDAFSKMHQNMFSLSIPGVDKREDQKYVYYEIPLNAEEMKNHKLNVNVKDGMISISESSNNSQSERQFSIDPGLDEHQAVVENQKDKIIIKIPKRS